LKWGQGGKEKMPKISRLSITILGLLALLLLATKGVDAQSSHAQSPNSGTWSFTGSMNVARYNHTATQLSNGQVLVIGGLDSSGSILTSAELYNPTTKIWSFTGSMNVARQNFRATPLVNGEVLVEGGIDATGMALTSAELYNPTTGRWSLTGSMNVGRENHQAVLLNNGKVLVAGGDTGTQNNPYIQALATAELYDPTAGTWSLTGSMHLQRFNQPMLLLSNGKVLVDKH
jgi:N-acetylneuraminic acid mutarotase